MKVLLVNGSPHKHGCTYTALTEIAKELNANGVETEIFHIGTNPVRGCIGCKGCAKLGKCICIKDNYTPQIFEGCASPDRICRNVLISGPQAVKDRINVIFINEDLGY